MKKCIKCGAELPDDAVFCPHCETSQYGKLSVTPPSPKRHRNVIAVICVVIVIAAAAAIIYALAGGKAEPQSPTTGPSPQPTESPAVVSGSEYDDIKSEDVWTINGKRFHVLLSFNGGGSLVSTPETERTDLVSEGAQINFPSMIYAYDADTSELAIEAFTANVESCSVEAVPLDGAIAVGTTEPAYYEPFPYAAFTSRLSCIYGCGTNEIIWTVKTTDGQELKLRHTVHIINQETLDIYPEDAPMETIEELRALLDDVAENVDPDTLVNIHLPAVTYEGGIEMTRRSFSFFGSTDGYAQTTFTDTITVGARDPQVAGLNDIVIEGSGEGIGLACTNALRLINCEIRGWDTGAMAYNGSWIAAQGCTFEDNGVGLHFNTDYVNMTDPNYQNDTFIGNGTAFLIENLPGKEILNFQYTRFIDNGTDIDNRCGYNLDTSGATFS